MITWQDKDGKKGSIKNRRRLSALHLVLASGLNCFKVQTCYSLKSVKVEIFLHSSCIEKASWEKRVWKKKLLVSLHDGTALWKSEQEQLTGRTHPPAAQKYKPSKLIMSFSSAKQAGVYPKRLVRATSKGDSGIYLSPQNPCTPPVRLLRAPVSYRQ